MFLVSLFKYYTSEIISICHVFISRIENCFIQKRLKSKVFAKLKALYLTLDLMKSWFVGTAYFTVITLIFGSFSFTLGKNIKFL